MTFTVHQWVDVFTRSVYVNLLLENQAFCPLHKGGEVYAWVVMSNHSHLIVRAQDGNLSDVIRDFKKHTAKALYRAISENKKESWREWLQMVLNYEDRVWFWEEGYHGEQVVTREFYQSKSATYTAILSRRV